MAKVEDIPRERMSGALRRSAVKKNVAAIHVSGKLTLLQRKLSNVLLDSTDGHAVCVIDLDTCMPGLSLHDFGDLMRSICSSEDEDTENPGRIVVRKDMFAALHAGYVKGATGMLTAEERALLPESGAVLTLEVAVRFLADYLAGDVYFRVKHPEHNLVRARAQLVLARKLVAAMPELHAIAAEQERE